MGVSGAWPPPLPGALVYKIKDKWYIEWKQTTTNDYEWPRAVQRVTTADNEWQRVTTNGNEQQRITASDITIDTASYNEWYNQWYRMTTNDNEWNSKWKRTRETINVSTKAVIHIFLNGYLSEASVIDSKYIKMKRLQDF